ncbi:MAG TPA: acyl-CoA dehydrogenase family protein [Microthrixaceae bacterium]|nr:acyl-CoA dehydrogenase family protein [Microthrixaceae bacterium]
MDFSFTEEQQATGELATQILTDLSTHDRLRELERSGAERFDREVWAKLAEAGLLGISLPESVGGAGLGLVELGRALQAAGKTAAAIPLWETLALGALPIAEFGSDEVAAKWLGGVVDGSTVLTAAWHEDNGDPLRPVVSAKSGADGWTITGTKICVPAGAIAQAVVVPAATDDGTALFVVAVGAGVTVTPLTTTSGSPDAQLEFAGSPATLLATGADALAWAFERAVATQCALSLGNAEAMLDLTAAYTKERKQFDVPIATFQAVGHRAADCYIDTEAIRLTCWQALTRLAEGLPATAEVSVAKFWSAWAGQRITLAAAHLHGGVGVDRDYPLARHYTRAKELELQLGGATPHLARIGAVLAA